MCFLWLLNIPLTYKYLNSRSGSIIQPDSYQTFPVLNAHKMGHVDESLNPISEQKLLKARRSELSKQIQSLQ